jgi:hypothetical protein
MITSGQDTSVLIPSQLPAFVRDDPNYQTFVAFLQAYYEWLELANTSNSLISTASSEQGITFASKNLLNYTDINSTTNDFLQYFINDFLPNLPESALISPQLAIKTARQLYQSKGTPASYKFLFRILYNSDFDYLDTEDFVLKPSSGNWYIAKSVHLFSSDTNFLITSNLRLFGQISETLATIQNVIQNGDKTEVFIDDIEREFQNGEIVSVLDSFNQPVYFYDGSIVSANTPGAETLSAIIVGQINQINIKSSTLTPNPYRGSLYNPGDPVVVYGGLNPNVANPIGATAEVGTVTSGYLTGITVTNGGYGYDLSNTIINIANALDASASIASVNPAPSGVANLTFFSTETIGPKANIQLGNSSYGFANNILANANTSLANTLVFITDVTYPISFVNLNIGGGVTSLTPIVTAITQYPDDYANTIIGNIPKSVYSNIISVPAVTSSNSYAYLSSLGILAPIQIANTGSGYLANDTIIITGGRGYGAYANITSLSNTGGIIGVTYVNASKQGIANNLYPIGGMGYTPNYLPSITIRTSTGSNASLYVPGILGASSVLTANTQRVGSITTINIINPGEDYVTTPKVSLNVLDVLVSNLTSTFLPSSGDVVYQGSSVLRSSMLASVDSIVPLINNIDPKQIVYNLRLYNYGNTSSIPASVNGPIFVNGKNIVMNISAFSYNSYYSSDGVRIYGDGTAQATASFLNGLSIAQGQYIDYAGQPSGYSVLESRDYNPYTYQITVDQTISVYKDVILKLLHPAGMNLLGRYAMKSNSNVSSVIVDTLQQGVTLSYDTNFANSNVVMSATFANPSNNIIQFNNLNGVNLANIIQIGNTISFTTNTNDIVTGVVTSVNAISNTVTISSNIWLSYANVAYVANGSYIIIGDLMLESGAEDLLNDITNNENEDLMIGPKLNILGLTNSYNLINGGIYSNPSVPLEDIVRVNDLLFVGNNLTQLNGNTSNVISVDYTNNVIYLDFPIANSAVNTFLSVNRTYTALGSNVFIYGAEAA